MSTVSCGNRLKFWMYQYLENEDFAVHGFINGNTFMYNVNEHSIISSASHVVQCCSDNKRDSVSGFSQTITASVSIGNEFVRIIVAFNPPLWTGDFTQKKKCPW